MMKIRHKKIVASGTAVALAGILGVGALLQSSVSVQASPAMMPGIEQIVNDTTAEKPFKILEIVDNTSEAEIGYYVSGQEPYVKLYSYTYKYKENNEEKSTVFQGQKDTQVIEKSIAKIRTSHLDGTTQTVDDLVKKLCPKERKWYGVKDDAGYLYVNFEGMTETTNILMQFSIFRDGSVKLTACQAGGAAVSPEAFVETFFQ